MPNQAQEPAKLTDTQMKLKKAIYSGHTLVGPWVDKRMDKQFQHDYRVRKLYSLPGKAASTFTTTNSGYGEFAAKEMIDSNTKIRDIDTYKRDDLGPKDEYYKSQTHSAHADPRTMKPPEYESEFDMDMVEKYKNKWSFTDPYMKRWEGKLSVFDAALGRPDGFDPEKYAYRNKGGFE
ncbi:unnamed protein product [Amoebophrya sp. A120]|nr:unnamed protein product [Amoebophrya sp. A120]|eukprot:GSA120T00014249001.1